MSEFNELIKKICVKNNICYEELSYGYIIKLSKNEKSHYIIGKKFDLNLDSSSIIACDKFATIEVLKSFEIPTIDSKIIFNPNIRYEFIPEHGNSSIILSLMEKYKKIVIKPNTGFGGNGVFLCSSLKQAEFALSKLFKKYDALLVSPYLDIYKEYRVFMLGGIPKLIYSKQKPYVIGNGTDNLKQLIEKTYENKKIVEKILDENKEEQSIIIQKGAKKNISWKHNLSCGAFVDNVSQDMEIYKDIIEIAKKSSNALNLNFATIDIIEIESGQKFVLEINSSIGTSIFSSLSRENKILIQNLFEDAILYLFR